MVVGVESWWYCKGGSRGPTHPSARTDLVTNVFQERTKMRNIAAKWLPLLAATFILFFLANPQPAAAQDDDPPARAARLSYVQGAVSFEPAGTDDWVDAIVNRPMTTGDKIWTDRDSRAEIRIDSYAMRLGTQTGFSFLNLDDNTVQIRLTEGSLNVRVRRLDDDQTLEIDTPNLAFNVLRPGSYRIDVNENGDTTVVAVRNGQGEVTGGGSAYPVHAGDSVSFYGTDQLDLDVQGLPYDDDFDRWNRDRDRRWDHSSAPRYVSDDVVGYEDLDDNGGWRDVPEYGTVWFPHTTIVGWAPYRYGHWVWISPWGWTWVDDAPWGFAPFHYGRWVVVQGVWGWVPSPPRPAVVTVAYVRPVYAPALVAWVGGGGVAAGVAWFPLGPRDVYCPSYHVSPRYVERVNVSNTVIVNRTEVTNVYNTVYVNKTVTNITYQNQREENAVTATSQASFTSAQPVGRNMVRVDARAVASAPVGPLTPAVVPQQRSVMGAGAEARVRPPAAVITRPVVAKTAPPPAPLPVTRQLQAVQANGGRPLAVSQIRQAQPETVHANVKVAPPANQATLPPQGQRANNRPAQNSQPAEQTQKSQQNNNRPTTTNQPNQPTAQNANRPPNSTATNPNQANPNQTNPNQGNPNRSQSNRSFNDRPPVSQPKVDPQVEQKQQQQLEQLRKQQDQERQRVEQQQVQQQQRLAQHQADERKQQQIQQQQQQQLEQLERKHDQEQQKLQQSQQKEVEKQQQKQQAPPPKKDNKDKDRKDRPPSR